MNKKKIAFRYLAFLLIAFFGIFLDRITKLWALHMLKDKPPIILIDGVLEFLYTENRGAAFGILQGRFFFFYLIAAIVIVFILYVIFRLPDGRKYHILLVLLSLITAGAVGNLIDRTLQHYVIDFIYFVPINFPVFNVADIFVSVSTFLLAFIFIFIFKEEDFNFLKRKRADKGNGTDS